MQQSDVILNVDAFEVVYGLIALYYIGNLGESMCEKKEHVCVPSLYVCLITRYTVRNSCGIAHLALLPSFGNELLPSHHSWETSWQRPYVYRTTSLLATAKIGLRRALHSSQAN